MSAALQWAALAAALLGTYFMLGGYLARVLGSTHHTRVERGIYRAIGVDGDQEQAWPVYARSVLAFSLAGVLGLYLLQRVQSQLPWSVDQVDVGSSSAWNTAVSFVTNTNWQGYAGESTMGHLTQMAGLTVQNFVSAAVGMAVATALIRGFVRTRTDQLGNFWVDLVRISIRVLLPAAAVLALLLVGLGVVQNLHGFTDITTLAGGTQSIPGGQVASQEAIKQLGTNGGGFYNANAAHPFENPTPLTNWLSIYAMLAIPFAMPRAFGRLLGDARQGHAVAAAMGLKWAASTSLLWLAESHPSGAAAIAGNAMEGKEARFGIPGSSLYAAATTLTSTGAVNSAHGSLTPFGGGVALLNMMTGEVVPGGAGSGMYGILVLSILAVFVAGLMVGRTPEYLGKKIRSREITMASLYILVTPVCLLAGTALALAMPSTRASLLNDGPHGLSEMLYAFTSASNNNGSAFAGLSANTTWLNTLLGLAMLIGRFVPIVLVLALAGSLAGQGHTPPTSGTLPTHRAQFILLLLGVLLIITLLTYVPALALGPLAEGLAS